MGPDLPRAKEEVDTAERIAQDRVLRKLLDDRFDCRHCPHLGCGRRLIKHCAEHMEQLRKELLLLPKKPER